MDNNAAQDILSGQFVSLLKRWDDGGFVKPYQENTIEVYFLQEMPAPTAEQKTEVDKYIAKKADGSYEFAAMSLGQQAQTRAAFAAISKVTGLQFVFVNHPAEGAIRIGTAKTIFGNGSESGGVNFRSFNKNGNPSWNDIYISKKANEMYGFGDQGYTTLLHEIGHALGLEHLSEAAEGTVGVSYSLAASVMSYAAWLDSQGGRAQGYNFGMTPLTLDILALQALYGTGATQSGNTRYVFDPKSLFPIEKLSPDANDDTHIYKGQVRALWDTSGVDTLDAQAYTESVNIDLRPGYLSSIGGTKNIAVAFNAQMENVIGGSGNDKLTGNEIDNELTGGKGNDLLYGREGVDTYVFNDAFGRDTVVDTDGLGQIKINGLSVGAAPAWAIPQSGNQAWVTELAGQQWLMQLRESSSSNTGYQLQINKSVNNKATDPNNTIVIDDFNVVRAMGEAGYLGIHLDGTPKLALRDAGGANPFEDTAFDPATLTGSATIAEHGGKSFTVYLNRPAQAGDTITLGLSALQEQFQVILGDSTIPAQGAVITLSEGQTQVGFALVQEGDVQASGAAQLSATYQGLAGQEGGQAAQATSNAWNVAITTDLIAACACEKGVGGRFSMQPANDGQWRRAA